MPSTPDYLVPHLEWEAIEFPLVLHDLEFEDEAYLFGPEASITLWRDANLQLDANLQARMINPRSLDKEQTTVKGNIIKQLSVRAKDENGHLVILMGCVLGGAAFNSWEANEDGYLAKFKLIFDTVRLVFSETPADKHFEWFFVQHMSLHLKGSTRRTLSSVNKKVRIGIDEDDDDDWRSGRSTSSDYFLLDIPELTCIVSSVPKECSGRLMSGICLEFRDSEIAKVDEKLLDDLKHFLSLLLGGKLYYMGYSKIAAGELTEAFMDSPGIPLKAPVSMPPILYNLQYDWGDFALQANLLFPAYRRLEAKLFLNHAMARYWIAQATPVGANLPVLAGGLEIIADAYLKMTGNDESAYLPKENYEQLIKDELLSLNQKLHGLPGAEAMLNKIKGAFRKGPNEKISLFFRLLEIDMGKPEKNAIKLRNNMTHARRDYSIKDNAHDDIISTRVYQALFNRVLLKILGYQGCYIDYSTQGRPLKTI